jgi:hypothetical protein
MAIATNTEDGFATRYGQIRASQHGTNLGTDPANFWRLARNMRRPRLWMADDDGRDRNVAVGKRCAKRERLQQLADSLTPRTC